MLILDEIITVKYILAKSTKLILNLFIC